MLDWVMVVLASRKILEVSILPSSKLGVPTQMKLISAFGKASSRLEVASNNDSSRTRFKRGSKPSS